MKVEAPERPAPVVERIAEAVRKPDVTVEALRALSDEALALRSGMMEAEADCMKQSLDPGNTVAEARTARESALDFAHEGKRLEAALAKIEEVLPGIQAAEHRAAIMPAYLDFKEKRAAFAARLRERWPKLTAEMIELLDEIERFRQSPGVEIPDGEDALREDVEALARGCDGSFFAAPYPGSSVQPVTKLRDGRIVSFTPTSAHGQTLAWPRGV